MEIFQGTTNLSANKPEKLNLATSTHTQPQRRWRGASRAHCSIPRVAAATARTRRTGTAGAPRKSPRLLVLPAGLPRSRAGWGGKLHRRRACVDVGASSEAARRARVEQREAFRVLKGQIT